MKKTLIFAASFLMIVSFLNGQTYLISDGGTVESCSGNFYDSGGPTGNYSNNEDDTITFCSSNNGRIRVNFTAMSLRNGDNLYVYYGNSAEGTPDITNPGTGTITSSCDCITFRFVSDVSNVRAGWNATISCIDPTLVQNDEVFNAIPVPLDGTCLTGQTNIGSTADYSSGCFSGGRTVWYDVSPDPDNNTIDVTLSNTTFPDGQVQYMLVYGFCGSLSFYPSSSIICGPASGTYQWTDLREGQYYLGVSTTAANVGNFDICVTQSWIDHCGDYHCGDTESCHTCPFDCGACSEDIGGPYFHPTEGIQNTYLGQCMVANCSGTYYDNAGPGAMYSNNIPSIYRTFCPDTPNTAMRATINLMQIEHTSSGCYDHLSVRNGPTQNSPTIWEGCGDTDLSIVRTIAGAYNGGVFTSTHPSGCLTFRFTSDFSNPGYWEGWDIGLSCEPFSGNIGTYNNDCSRAIPICSDASISSEIWGPGQSSDGCGGCVLQEAFSEWYWFRMATGGTIEMEINPNGNSDMDFALYKTEDCSDLGMPVRCSYAQFKPPGKTGMRKGEGDVAEDVTGNQWVSEINVNTGDVYYLMISEWQKNNPNHYTIRWTLTNGASFDCSIILPVELLSFYSICSEYGNTVIWETSSETNNDFFTLERSYNGLNFEPIAYISGAGTSNEKRQYIYNDSKHETIVYYKLTQTDYDGKYKTFDIISSTCSNQRQFSLTIADHSAEGYIEVLHDSESNMNYYLTLTNVLGNSVFAENYNASGDVEYRKISTKNLKSGIYVLNILSALNNHTQKIRIQ